MEYYLDTSVAMHAVLPGGNPAARKWIDLHYGIEHAIFSSSLLKLEMIRTLRRDGLPLSLSRALLDRISLISIDDGVLSIAAGIETHVRSLDAVHLATASLLGFGTAVVTHDGQMRHAAETLGLEAIDPLRR